MPAPKGNQNAKGNRGGRPTNYNRLKHPDMVKGMAMMGWNDEKIIKHAKVSTTTFYQWKQRHIEFAKALEDGRENADIQAVNGLFSRAIGCKVRDVSVMELPNGTSRKTTTEKEIPPDTNAALQWLYNRQPLHWKNKVDVKEEVTHQFPAKEVLDAIYAAGLARAKERDKFLVGRRERLGLLTNGEAGFEVEGEDGDAKSEK